MLPPTPSPLSDVGAADWLLPLITGFEGRVRDVVPATYDAYARIFHRPDQGMPIDGEPESWGQLAEIYGTVLHPAAQFDHLTGQVPDSSASRSGPAEPAAMLVGTLDQLTLPALVALLEPHTDLHADCLLALWSGFGNSADAWRTAPKFRLPGRQYWLFKAPLDEVVAHSLEFEHAGRNGSEHGEWLRAYGAVKSPTLWWPQDHTWFVGSEIDFDSTIVAGSRGLIDSVLDCPDLEVLEVDPDTELHAEADRINRH